MVGMFILVVLILISAVLIFVSERQRKVMKDIVSAEESLKYHKRRSECYLDSADEHLKVYELQLSRHKYHDDKVNELTEVINDLSNKLIR